MGIDFKSYDSVILIFSTDMSKIALIDKFGKLDGITYKDKTKVNEVEISKRIKNDFDLQIDPYKFRTVVTLQNIDAIRYVTIYMTIADLEKIKKDTITVSSINSIPECTIPQLKWLIPMSIDSTIYGCECNQLLTR